MAGSLSGRTAAVTGGECGIGAGCAKVVAAAGARVFLPHGDDACLRIVVARHDDPSRTDCA